MFFRAAVVWLAILVLAVLNGALRDGFVSPRLGETAGRAISTVLLSLFVFAAAYVSHRWIGAKSSGEALQVGIFWTALTLAFEFLAGHYLFGDPWEKLLAEYNVLRGRTWPLVLLATLFSPFLVSKLRR